MARFLPLPPARLRLALAYIYFTLRLPPPLLVSLLSGPPPFYRVPVAPAHCHTRARAPSRGTTHTRRHRPEESPKLTCLPSLPSPSALRVVASAAISVERTGHFFFLSKMSNYAPAEPTTDGRDWSEREENARNFAPLRNACARDKAENLTDSKGGGIFPCVSSMSLFYQISSKHSLDFYISFFYFFARYQLYEQLHLVPIIISVSSASHSYNYIRHMSECRRYVPSLCLSYYIMFIFIEVNL